MDTGAGEPSQDNAGDGVPEEPAGVPEGELAEVAWEPAPMAGRYQIGDYLGESRLGRTYRAWDGDDDQDVEVIFLDAEAVADPDEVAAWLEELRNLRHLHVLPLLDWQLDPVPYLVYPVPQMRLQRLIESGSALTPSQTLLIGLQAAETLHSLRQVGVTHGAITPASCSLDVRGRIRLAEMGVDFLRRPVQPFEATRYDAPETIEVDDLGAPTDLDGVGDAEWGLEAGEPVEDIVGAGTFEDGTSHPPALAEDETDDISGAIVDDPPAGELARSGEAEASPPPAESGEAVATEAGESEAPDEDPVAAAAAADVFGLAVVLAEATAGQPVPPPAINRLGRSVVPAGAGTATARHLTRLAPLLAQASAARPENRLEADELALALRATAEMFPPPTRLDEAFQRAEEWEEEPDAPQPDEVDTTLRPRRIRSLALSLAAAVAIIAAGVLLVLLSAPGDDTPAHVVPGVVGMDWSRASDTLSDSGWEVRRLEVRVPGAATGEVVGQLPEPGGLLDEGQAVKVQVNLGEPLIVIPADVVGMTVEEARLRLSAIGLRVGRVQTLVDPTATEGSVVAIAEALPELPRGSTVDLVVAVGG
ncbi:MAG: PASTA domain-containing protein [bacterium]|nr:PASTA domain-containing protein [bacterium]